MDESRYGYIIISIPKGINISYSEKISESIIELMGKYNWNLIHIDAHQPYTAEISYSERHLIFEKNLSQSRRLVDTMYVLFGNRYIYDEEDYMSKLETLT